MQRAAIELALLCPSPAHRTWKLASHRNLWEIDVQEADTGSCPSAWVSLKRE